MGEAVNERVPPALAGERLDRVVAMLTGLTRHRVADLIAAGGVQVNGGVVAKPSRRLVEGDAVHVDEVDDPIAYAEGDESVAVTVVHADDAVVVVDKPAGLVVHPGAGTPTGTLVNGLVHRFPDMAGVGPDPTRPGVVHRLDRGTSGLLVVARTQPAYESLVAQLSARSVERHYVTVVAGAVEAEQGMVDAAIGRHPRDPTKMAVTADGREARTRYIVRERFTAPVVATRLECQLETGRTHQIRVHLAAIGHPVVGDARYGGTRAIIDLDRPFLHAEFLAFDHPATGEHLSFESPVPADLADALRILRGG